MSDRRVTTEEQRWPPPRDAVETQRWLGPEGADGPRIALIRHPAAPYPDGADIADFGAVTAAAHAYLTSIHDLELLPVPECWLEALAPRQSDPWFGWLPIKKAVVDTELNVGSLPVFDTRGEEGTRHVNRGLVLLAGLLAGGQPLGSEIGLRVMIDAAPGNGAGILIRSASIALPYGPYGRKPEGELAQLVVREGALVEFLTDSRVRTRIGGVAGLDADTLTLRGSRIARLADHAATRDTASSEGRQALDVRMRGLTPANGNQPRDAYEIFLRLNGFANGDKQLTIAVTNRVLLSACAVDERDFPLDPASHGGPSLWRKRRPTRSQSELASELEDDDIPPTLQVADQFDVVQTWFAHDAAPPAVKTIVPTLAPRLRSNDFTAVSAFRNVRALFARFSLYGLPLGPYFQHATLPLIVRYRFGVRPGPGKDGQTVNGRVLPHGWPADASTLLSATAQRPQLEMHLALADLRVRDRDKRVSGSLSFATPLGFADDPRWVWHEFAHVLLMAALGELEFRFAHSMGDGLAAIVADPRSRLSVKPLWRGATYPFVFAPRRHDRCVACGWGWSGLLGRAMREAPERNRLQRKAYTTEQILSTSLFRMYRCFGGDTVDTAVKAVVIMRSSASAYAVYLIMKALSLLGAPATVPAEHAGQFVDALIAADVLTTTPVPVEGGGPSRVGGTTWKAIRWAFEAQGMFADPGNENGPGTPPLVDVFIADNRVTKETFPSGPIEYGEGSYAPVSLDWAQLTDGTSNGKQPEWFAAAAVMVQHGVTVDVTVGNRGTQTAIGVFVRLWATPWGSATSAPDWDRAVWKLVDTSIAANIGAGATQTFAGLALPGGGGNHLVLAEAVCAADRANIDPAAGLAPSAGPAPLEELVPLDNNLGLILV